MNYPVIALWSHPRSMSTAFERVMRARGDLECLHEPFMYDYYINRSKRTMPHFDAEDQHPRNYEAIRDMILEKAERGPVFFKDMSYYVVPHIFDDPVFLNRITHSFLLRDLKASIVSYAKLDPDLTQEEIGIEAQWRLAEFLMKQNGSGPVVVQSERIRVDPHGQMRAYWNAVGLADRPEALNWDDNAPKDWQQVSGWHQDVMSSKTIRPITAEQELETEANFDRLIAERPHFQLWHYHHDAFQRKLLAFAI